MRRLCTNPVPPWSGSIDFPCGIHLSGDMQSNAEGNVWACCRRVSLKRAVPTTHCRHMAMWQHAQSHGIPASKPGSEHDAVR